MLVFSTTDRDSFQAIDSWKEKVEAEVGDIPTVLVQNKIDLLEETVVKKWVPLTFCKKKKSPEVEGKDNNQDMFCVHITARKQKLWPKG